MAESDVALQLLHDDGVVKLRDRSPQTRSARRALLIRAVMGEFLCSFVFFFSVCGIALNMEEANFTPGERGIATALTAGFAAIALIFSFADISGAHFNPAVTFATWLSRKTSNRKSILFVISQLLGSMFAMLALMLCFHNPHDKMVMLSLVPKEDLGKVFFMEFTLTFIFVFVIFTTAFENIEQKKYQTFRGMANAYGLTLYSTSPQTKTGFAPFAIGFTVGFLTLIGGAVSGGAFNPARVFAPALFSGEWKHQWVYWLGDLSGAATAAGVQFLFHSVGTTHHMQKSGSMAVPLTVPLLDEQQQQQHMQTDGNQINKEKL